MPNRLAPVVGTPPTRGVLSALKRTSLISR